MPQGNAGNKKISVSIQLISYHYNHANTSNRTYDSIYYNYQHLKDYLWHSFMYFCEKSIIINDCILFYPF